MSYDAEKLLGLLPVLYRMRDAEQDGQLKALLGVLAEQAAVIEEDLARLYDDQFIETCSDWAAPYVGGVIGYRTLHGVMPTIASPRAEVANTIAYRRRKGTAAMLEQLARDVTGWSARAVEFFERLATTQYMNHVRLHSRLAHMREWEPLARTDTAFDALAHSVDVRRIGKGGRYNIPNIGIFLWRLGAFPLRQSPAARVDARSYRFHPLNTDIPLFTRPETEERITHIAEPINTPEPILRRILADRTELYYGQDLSIEIEVDGMPVAVETIDDSVTPSVTFRSIRSCNLADGGWMHPEPVEEATPPPVPPLMAAIDPELGRIAFNKDLAANADIRVTYHYGFSAEMGGGAYSRAQNFSTPETGEQPKPVPDAHATIQDALDALPPEGGVVEIRDNSVYTDNITINAPVGHFIELRAADGYRPTLHLTGNLEVRGGAGATVILDGLLIAGAAVTVPAGGGNALERLIVRHCTLVPGRDVQPGGAPAQPAATSLSVSAASAGLRIESSIIGAIRVGEGQSETPVHIENSIIDATTPENMAYAAPGGGDTPGRAITVLNSTIIGRIFARRFELVSNAILHARRAAPADPPPVRTERRQTGCMRFSFVPLGSVTPRRYRCQPQLYIDRAIADWEAQSATPVPASVRAQIRARAEARIRPHFTAERWVHPAYMQLASPCPEEIRTGADDEAEMGAFHDLFQPQREANLRIRLEEYLRFGLEAGVFYET